MFSWGEDSHRGFLLKDRSNIGPPKAEGLHHLQLSYHLTALSAGHTVVAFLKSNGNAFIIPTTERKDGRRVRGKQKYVNFKDKIKAVSCGDDTVTLLSERGQVLCADKKLVPRPLKMLCAVSQVACGSHHSVALTKDGRVFVWGQGSRGQLGLGKQQPSTKGPQHLKSLSAIPLVQIAAGGEQSFALSVSGAVFSWGGNHCGQLGLGDTTDRHTPTPVRCLNLKKTIHVSCGKDHTATLTKDGAVFTFGSGKYGQLGHNSFRDELRPRLVAELWGAKVTKIACGRHHTLVLMDSKRVYSFGCGEQGQLGHGKESHPSVPLPVQLPKDTSGDAVIRNIFAGGNCSFATYTSTEDVQQEANTVRVNTVTHCLDHMIDKWTAECDSKSWKQIKQEICRMFSSVSCVNASFLEKSKDEHFQTSPKYCGLNLPIAQLAFQKLVKKDKVFAEVENALLHLPSSLDKKPVGVEGLRIFLILNELLHVIQNHQSPLKSIKLAKAVSAAVLNLSAGSLQVIGDWWTSLPPSTMITHVEVWKQALSVILSDKPDLRNSEVRNLLLVLQHMYNVNSRTAEPQKIPESEFCLLMNKNMYLEDWLLWRLGSQYKRNTEPLILCSFPSVMDLESKKYVFDLNVHYTKFKAQNRITCEITRENGVPQPQDLVFEVDVRRGSVLKDTFEHLALTNQSHYKIPLVVYYDTNLAGVRDLYGYVKDFFYEVFHEMVSAETGMFMYNDSKTLAWFPSKAAPEDQRYLHFGVLCGLALYNQCILHLPFPLALFKKLLGVKPSLGDMMEFSPCVGECLKNILEDYTDDEIETLDMDFSINWDGTNIDLEPKNPVKLLTGQNKKEYVEAYVNHAFNTSVQGVFQDFKRGFFQVCEEDLVKLFRPQELQGVLVGKDFNDWAKLKQATVYEGAYNTTPQHRTIQMFWEVFDDLTEDQKKAFLWFVTGFERVPILAMEKFTMKIQIQEVEDYPDEYYPKAHTCFSGLELPLYSTKEIMRTRLTEALSSNKIIFKDAGLNSDGV
ncbi:hypothetical protein PBY51_012376 [Eleginops maclovinus]|uniref:HECT domain-containing protein n=1 Tax=Eleginops maclovinus TaxID=56733 RepID=A0AAN7XW21_ELEMC|nr:hypothetical protein PBY51_012376 [Eleginops maclovinus]